MTILDAAADARRPLLDAVEDAIAAHDPSAHPFLVAWSDGRLSRETLRGFAPQFRMLVDEWPRMVSAVHSITRDAATRRDLVEALSALECGNATPDALWLQTCAALGLSSATVREAIASHATEACINDYRHLCEQDTIAGLAALYVLSRQLRATCRIKQDGLAQYGVDHGPGSTFFEVVGLLVEAQARILRRALEREVAMGGDYGADEAVAAANAALTALHGLFHGALALA